MAGNRVEELEAKVRELEATIDGLTDELVETKERLQAVEDETGVQDDVLERRSTPARERQADEARQADAQPDEEPTDGDAEPSADEVNSDEAEEEDTADSESGDDIIVA